MGSPVSSIVANLYIEVFKDRALRISQNPPRLWKRYVDDAFVIQQTKHKQNILQHIYSIDSAIKFTVEDTRPNGSMPFLDTLVIPEHNGTLCTRVNRKLTHMDHYLQWDSHHHIGAVLLKHLTTGPKHYLPPKNTLELKKNTSRKY